MDTTQDERDGCVAELDLDGEEGEVVIDNIDYEDDKYLYKGSIVWKLWEDKEAMHVIEDSKRSMNLAILVYYLKGLGVPPRSKWLGQNGTIYHICEVFNIGNKKKKC